MKEYDGKVRLVIKNYPYKYRDYARLAARASLAAAEQGKYREMHDLLIANSPKLDRASLLGYARQLGLDLKRFTEAVDGTRHDAAIDRDLALAASLDLYNTPTYYINGRRVVGNRPFDYLKKIIDEELRNARR